MAIERGTMEDMGALNHLWQGRRVFVTGATGMVGAWLVKDLIAMGASVVALVRDPDPQSEFYRSGNYRGTTIVQGSLEDYWTLERAVSEHEVDTVFHLAAQPIVGVGYRSPLRTFESNVRGTYNMMEVCRQHREAVKRVVIASSDKAYGEQTVLPYTEDMPLQGRSPYEVSKSCTDLIARSYYHTYAMPIAIARCGNIYGGGDLNWSRIVPDTIRSCLRSERLVVRSDGSYLRDYIYVKDVVSAYMRLAESLDNSAVWGEAFNFSPEHPLSVLEIVTRIQSLMGCEHLAPAVQNSAHGEIHSQYLDAAKARRVLHWQPGYSLDEGLAETIAWYREYFQEQARAETKS